MRKLIVTTSWLVVASAIASGLVALTFHAIWVGHPMAIPSGMGAVLGLDFVCRLAHDEEKLLREVVYVDPT